MTKIDIISGFLGAGKTTLIKKLLAEALQGTKTVLIENEFGEIGVDGGFLKDAGFEIREMNSGCICCSLVGDFQTSLSEVIAKYSPERILIEPSGVGKLSDVQKAVLSAAEENGVEPGSSIAVVDASKCRVYMKNFGEFFIDQIEHAGTIILSRTQGMDEAKLAKVVEMIREHNHDAKIVTTPWDELTGKYILDTFEAVTSFEEELLAEVEHEHHHHHDDEHEHEHHHHDDDHDHGDGCSCGCGHDHHGHHHADDVFTSIGMETAALYTEDEVKSFLEKLEDEATYGFVLRAKGMLPSQNGKWVYFDYVPGEMNVREGSAEYTGKVCVIGSELKEEAIRELVLTRKGN